MSPRKQQNALAFEQQVNFIVDSSHKVYGSHSYAAGYLGSLARTFFDSLSLKDQESWIRCLEKSTSEMNAKVA